MTLRATILSTIFLLHSPLFWAVSLQAANDQLVCLFILLSSVMLMRLCYARILQSRTSGPRHTVSPMSSLSCSLLLFPDIFSLLLDLTHLFDTVPKPNPWKRSVFRLFHGGTGAGHWPMRGPESFLQVSLAHLLTPCLPIKYDKVRHTYCRECISNCCMYIS